MGHRFPEYKHTPIAMSSSKSFNLARLQTSYIVTENIKQRRRLNKIGV